MGNQKQKWKAEEEEALLAGVAKHGAGRWQNILKDPDFAPFLTHRSNIDLKDKWRNLNVSTGAQGSKEKTKTPKIKASVAASVSPVPYASNNTSDFLFGSNASSEMAIEDRAMDENNPTRYNTIIFEAISASKDTNGSDFSAIINIIEQKHKVPPNFRRLLNSKLRRLVSQGKLEKVRNCYKICKPNVLGVKTPPPKQKDARSRHSNSQGSVISQESVKEAALTAAYKVAEAENKLFLAAEAVKEAEQVARMAQDTEAMLEIFREIHQRCAKGEIVLVV